MERPELRIVAPGGGDENGRPRRLEASILLVATLAAGLIATLGGADAARDANAGTRAAREALERLLVKGPDAPETLEALVATREHLGSFPLDAAARVAYASVLAEAGRGQEGAFRAAEFHARRALELAPYTVPIVSGSAQVLARIGNEEAALVVVRSMFEYDPGAAAGLLSRIEGSLVREPVREGLAGRAEAWLAWARQLQRSGRFAAAESALEEAHRRWPMDDRLLEALAGVAAGRGDVEALRRLIPPEHSLAAEPGNAALLAFRARVRAAAGDATGAAQDARLAEALGGDRPEVLVFAGDAHEAAGDGVEARRLYGRALHRYREEAGAQDAEASVLARIARSLERSGRTADAIRAWRETLEVAPGDAEARGRLLDLAATVP